MGEVCPQTTENPGSKPNRAIRKLTGIKNKEKTLVKDRTVSIKSPQAGVLFISGLAQHNLKPN